MFIRLSWGVTGQENYIALVVRFRKMSHVSAAVLPPRTVSHYLFKCVQYNILHVICASPYNNGPRTMTVIIVFEITIVEISSVEKRRLQ